MYTNFSCFSENLFLKKYSNIMSLAPQCMPEAMQNIEKKNTFLFGMNLQKL